MPFIVDRYGNVRWYLQAEGTKYAIQRLRNGNIGFGTSEQAKVLEYTMLGEKVREWSVAPEYRDIHHDVFEKEDGNFLVTADGLRAVPARRRALAGIRMDLGATRAAADAGR